MPFNLDTKTKYNFDFNALYSFLSKYSNEEHFLAYIDKCVCLLNTLERRVYSEYLLYEQSYATSIIPEYFVFEQDIPQIQSKYLYTFDIEYAKSFCRNLTKQVISTDDFFKAILYTPLPEPHSSFIHPLILTEFLNNDSNYIIIDGNKSLYNIVNSNVHFLEYYILSLQQNHFLYFSVDYLMFTMTNHINCVFNSGDNINDQFKDLIHSSIFEDLTID